MIKIDLITGFLGSGKTTFIKKYARFLMDQGLRIGILENDFGAINVDMLVLNELRGENCELEMVAGGCDSDCHKRRFKTKLISMAISGYQRVLVEPSGIFDVDEFFDVLREEPLDNWYEIGNIISIVDSELDDDLSDASTYLLASEMSNAGCVLFSKVQEADVEKIENTKRIISDSLLKVKCSRNLENRYVIKDWNFFSKEDFDLILNSGYVNSSFEKKHYDEDEVYKSIYFMETGIDKNGIKEFAESLLQDSSFGKVFRVKGFVKENNQFLEINATKKNYYAKSVPVGQEVIIVIGENLDENKINSCLHSAQDIK